MHIEIDQSGKIEQTDMDTVVAFSNNHQYAVLLPKELKRGYAKPQKTLSEKDVENMIRGAPKSRPASTTLSAKLRHGLAWHPSSTLCNMYNNYIKLLVMSR